MSDLNKSGIIFWWITVNRIHQSFLRDYSGSFDFYFEMVFGFFERFFLFFDEPVFETVSFENFYSVIIGGAFITYLARFLLRTAHRRQLNSF